MAENAKTEINRTRVPQESASSYPASSSFVSARNAELLTQWLGSFWSEVYEDPDFIADLQNARALRIAQLYLDLLENLKLEDRTNAPVFHRERWHPIIIRKSQRNIGSKGMFKLADDGTVVLGPQTHEVYPDGTVVTLGGRRVNYRDMVVYPFDAGSEELKGTLSCIANNIADASVVLGNGTNFTILDGAIAIAEDQDPFTGVNADKWPKFEIAEETPAGTKATGAIKIIVGSPANHHTAEGTRFHTADGAYFVTTKDVTASMVPHGSDIQMRPGSVGYWYTVPAVAEAYGSESQIPAGTELIPVAEQEGVFWSAEAAEPFTGGVYGDTETVLWVCDALFDRNFIYTALGYAMRLPTGSSEVYKRVVNATWNITASGATPLLVRSLMAAICGVPTVREDGEVVESVINDGGRMCVATDRNTYLLPSNARLRRNVRRGKALRRFDTLDRAIRVYACTTEPEKIPAYSDFVDDFEELKADVPALDLPPAMFHTSVERGFSVAWAEEDVVCAGIDANGNPMLRFSLDGEPEDEDAFWHDTWLRYEKAGVSMETCLDGVEHDTIFTPGKVCARISPMLFFMRNLVGANTLIITVCTDTVADDAPLYDPKFFNVLRDAVPAYVRLYVIEHQSTPEDLYDTEQHDTWRPGDTREYDEADMAAYDSCGDEVSYRGRKAGARWYDRVDTKWIASCRGYYEDNDY